MKITVADSLFLQYGKTAKLGGENKSISPTYFEWERADADTARFVTDSELKYAKGEGQVAFLLETFFLHPEDYLTALEKPFDYVLTHNMYFARHKENWLWYPHGGSFVDFGNWKVHEKTKNISILLSPKKQLHGHKVFHEVAEKYRDLMDVYGLDGYADKMDAIAPYRFSVVVEAERAESFFSEKLLDCFAVGTIPIYLGCPNIGEFFNTNGIAEVSSIYEMEILLKRFEERHYISHLDCISSNLEFAKQYRLPEDWIYEHYPELFQ